VNAPARPRLSAPGAAPPAPLDLAPLEIDEFLTWLLAEKGRSANTIAAYRRDLLAYARWLGATGETLATVTGATLDAYVAHTRAQGRAPATVTRSLVAVRSLHRFLADEEMAESDPGAAVEVPRVPAGLPKALSEAEVERLLQLVVGEGPWVLRDRAVLEVLYGTGARISELVGLSLADVDLGSALLRVFGKGAKERVVPLGRCARDALGAWLGPAGRDAVEPQRWARRGDAEAVLLNQRAGRLSRQGAWGIVRKYGDAAGLGDRLTPHVLRHSCATHMLDHGADIRAVQELLGHASISTTQVYTLVSSERLAQVYLAAHPRAQLR